MALPKQLSFNLSKEEYISGYNLFDGKKARYTRNWLLAILAVFELVAAIFIAFQFGSACQYVGDRLDYSTFSFARLNTGAVITAVVLMVLTPVVGVIALNMFKKQNEQLFEIYYNRYHDGVIVLGNESFLYRSGDKKIEINKRYDELYEAHENEDCFLLVTYDDDQIIVPKKDMDRDTYSKVSMLLTEYLKVYFFKMGISNFDVNDHVLIKKADPRAAIKKLGR